MFVIPTTVLEFLNGLSLPTGPLVIGVSGGADSLYLTYILSKWAKNKKRKLIAVTVDHALRAESQKEAEWVHKELTKRHILHHILTWEGIKPKARIEERAREKRYELLLDFCEQNKACALFLAHHQQDQIETFWARLAHSSGLDGLCAMSACTKRNRVLIIRPLLQTPKPSILSALKQNKCHWLEDPMNQDSVYERVRWRQNQVNLDKMGLTSDCVEKSIRRLQRAQKTLEFYTNQFLTTELKKSPYGFVQMDEKKFLNLPEDIRVRALVRIFKIFNPTNRPISLESIEKIVLTMPKNATLAGCQWVISHRTIFIAPELRCCTQKLVSPHKWTQWGNILVLSNQAFMATAEAPKPRLKNIPFLIQRTFLKVPPHFHLHRLESEKKLEKKEKLDYKGKTPYIIIRFNEQKEI